MQELPEAGKNERVHSPGSRTAASQQGEGWEELGSWAGIPHRALVPGGSPEACHIQEVESRDVSRGGLNVLLKLEELLSDVFLKT